MATFTPAEFERALKAAPEKLAQAIIPRLVARAREFRERILVRNRLSGRPGLNAPSGNLRRSFRQDPEGDVSGRSLDGFTLTEFSVSPYATVHEDGATIAARRVSNLAIPLGPVKTETGVKRAGVRSFSDTFVRRSKAGNLLVWQRGAKGEKPTAIFLFRPNVQIPARLNYYGEWQINQEARRTDVAKAVKEALDGIK